VTNAHGREREHGGGKSIAVGGVMKDQFIREKFTKEQSFARKLWHLQMKKPGVSPGFSGMRE
jgi:hypothetical protein